MIPSLSVLTVQVSGEIDSVNPFALYLYTLFINTMHELGKSANSDTVIVSTNGSSKWRD